MVLRGINSCYSILVDSFLVFEEPKASELRINEKQLDREQSHSIRVLHYLEGKGERGEDLQLLHGTSGNKFLLFHCGRFIPCL